MDRQNYQLEQNPQYTEDIPRLLNDDPVLAESGAFHDLIVRSLNNTKASYQKAEKAQKTADSRASIVLSHEEAVPAKGDNTYTFQVTELSDVVGEIDSEKLEHARKIGELENSLNGWKIYNSLEELELDSSVHNLPDICSGMSGRSKLYYSVSEDTSGTYPISANQGGTGLVEIIKYNNNRCFLNFFGASSLSYTKARKRWINSWKASEGMSGWEMLGSDCGTWTPELISSEGKPILLKTQLGHWEKTGNRIHIAVRLGIESAENLSHALHIPLPKELYCSPKMLYTGIFPVRHGHVSWPGNVCSLTTSLHMEGKIILEWGLSDSLPFPLQEGHLKEGSIIAFNMSYEGIEGV